MPGKIGKSYYLHVQCYYCELEMDKLEMDKLEHERCICGYHIYQHIRKATIFSNLTLSRRFEIIQSIHYRQHV